MMAFKKKIPFVELPLNILYLIITLNYLKKIHF